MKAGLIRHSVRLSWRAGPIAAISADIGRRRVLAPLTVRHPPQSGWLDEWDRLKGGHLLSLGVALKRACINGSELSVCSIRGFLLADVLADLLQFKADRGDSVTAGPEMFAREIPLLTAQPGNGDCTLPL